MLELWACNHQTPKNNTHVVYMYTTAFVMPVSLYIYITILLNRGVKVILVHGPRKDIKSLGAAPWLNSLTAS